MPDVPDQYESIVRQRSRRHRKPEEKAPRKRFAVSTELSKAPEKRTQKKFLRQKDASKKNCSMQIVLNIGGDRPGELILPDAFPNELNSCMSLAQWEILVVLLRKNAKTNMNVHSKRSSFSSFFKRTRRRTARNDRYLNGIEEAIIEAKLTASIIVKQPNPDKAIVEYHISFSPSPRMDEVSNSRGKSNTIANEEEELPVAQFLADKNGRVRTPEKRKTSRKEKSSNDVSESRHVTVTLSDMSPAPILLKREIGGARIPDTPSLPQQSHRKKKERSRIPFRPPSTPSTSVHSISSSSFAERKNLTPKELFNSPQFTDIPMKKEEQNYKKASHLDAPLAKRNLFQNRRSNDIHQKREGATKRSSKSYSQTSNPSDLFFTSPQFTDTPEKRKENIVLERHGLVPITPPTPSADLTNSTFPVTPHSDVLHCYEAPTPVTPTRKNPLRPLSQTTPPDVPKSPLSWRPPGHHSKSHYEYVDSKSPYPSRSYVDSRTMSRDYTNSRLPKKVRMPPSILKVSVESRWTPSHPQNPPGYQTITPKSSDLSMPSMTVDRLEYSDSNHLPPDYSYGHPT